jgi:hypothetical protein
MKAKVSLGKIAADFSKNKVLIYDKTRHHISRDCNPYSNSKQFTAHKISVDKHKPITLSEQADEFSFLAQLPFCRFTLRKHVRNKSFQEN